MTKNRLFFLSFIFLSISIFFSCATTSSAKNDISGDYGQLELSELCPQEFVWDEIEPGFWKTEFKVKSLGIRYECVKIDLTNPELKIITGNETYFFRLKKFASKNKNVVTVNTTPFDLKNPANVVGIIKDNGKIISEPVSSYCALGLYKTTNGYEAEIIEHQNAEDIERMDYAFGGFFQILKENEINDYFIRNRRSRSGCGVSPDKKTLYVLVSTSGFELRDLNGLTYQECARILQAAGCTNGMQFDGGHSTGLCIYNKQVLCSLLQRKVPAAIGFTTK